MKRLSISLCSFSLTDFACTLINHKRHEHGVARSRSCNQDGRIYRNRSESSLNKATNIETSLRTLRRLCYRVWHRCCLHYRQSAASGEVRSRSEEIRSRRDQSTPKVAIVRPAVSFDLLLRFTKTHYFDSYVRVAFSIRFLILSSARKH